MNCGKYVKTWKKYKNKNFETFYLSGASKYIEMEEEKKYFISVVEEFVLNPDFHGFRGGRIEIYDGNNKYAIWEFRIFLPERIFEKVREAFDFEEMSEKELKNSFIEFDGEKVLRNSKE